MTYSNDTSSLNFFNTFVKSHKRLSSSDEDKLVRQFRYAYDTYMQLQKEKSRVKKEIELAVNNKDTKELFYLHKELFDIEDLIKNDKQINNMHYYRNKLIEHNLRLVIKIASYYSEKTGSTVENLDDLIQEGTLGFIRAIEKFDPREGVALGTYSTWWIRQKITRSLSNKSRTIRLPVHVASRVTKILKCIKDNAYEFDDSYIPLIAKELKLSEKKVREAFIHIHGFYPINQVIMLARNNADNDASQEEADYSDFIEDGQSYSDVNKTIYLYDILKLKDNLNEVLKRLSIKDQFLLAFKYGWSGLPASSYRELEDKMQMINIPIANGKTAVPTALHALLEEILQ